MTWIEVGPVAAVILLLLLLLLMNYHGKSYY
jgi:hypothetical protein